MHTNAHTPAQVCATSSAMVSDACIAPTYIHTHTHTHRRTGRHTHTHTLARARCRCDIFAKLRTDDYRKVRKLMVEMVSE